VSPAPAPVTPFRPSKGPAPAFEGIVDLDPRVTLFNTATGVVKSDISPKLAQSGSTPVEKMIGVWNRKMSNDSEMRELCDEEMKKLEGK